MFLAVACIASAIECFYIGPPHPTLESCQAYVVEAASVYPQYPHWGCAEVGIEDEEEDTIIFD